MAALSWRRRIGIAVGPTLFVLGLLTAPPGGMSETAWRAAGVGLWMATWWLTEAIPIPATALLPIVLFPLLGVLDIGAATAPYANPVIFLFMGGLLLAIGLESSGLHVRFALNIVRLFGARPPRLVAGFMAATAFISMWVSNTATVAMMLPLGTSVLMLARSDTSHDDANLGTALMLGIAYAASIGGIATLIGTPPNALLAAFLAESYDIRVSFAQWLLIGLPLVIVALPLTWLLLVRLVYPLGNREIAGGRDATLGALRGLGAVSRAEWTVGAVVALTAIAWITSPLLERVLPGISDAGIAMAGALLLFIIPARARGGPVLTWEAAERLPWGVLVLFGGGLSLARAAEQTGLTTWIGEALRPIGDLPLVLVVLGVTTVVVFLTELTSNTATAAAFLPVVASLAIAIGADPVMLAVPAALAASCAFMLPVATPPNALVYASGRVTIPQMVRAGFWLNIMSIGLITILTLALARTLHL